MKQHERRLKALEEHSQPSTPRPGGIVLYDPATGVCLPGYEPNPGPGVQIWIPSNGRERAEDGRWTASCD